MMKEKVNVSAIVHFACFTSCTQVQFTQLVSLSSLEVLKNTGILGIQWFRCHEIFLDSTKHDKWKRQWDGPAHVWPDILLIARSSRRRLFFLQGFSSNDSEPNIGLIALIRNEIRIEQGRGSSDAEHGSVAACGVNKLLRRCLPDATRSEVFHTLKDLDLTGINLSHVDPTPIIQLGHLLFALVPSHFIECVVVSATVLAVTDKT